MKKYQYQVIRYIHDRVTSEFVNIGIIMFQPETHFLKAKFISKYSRISNFFSEINGHFLLTTLKQFEKEIERAAENIGGLFFDTKYISEISNAILPKDDSALECSEIYNGIDVDAEAALDDLFERLVNKYTIEPEQEILGDKHVWKSIYKEYFDKYNVTKALKAHTVKTANDTLVFDKARKNGSWHCYQAVSFDLKKTEAIKSKVYKWSGIINELDSAGEAIHLYFLTLSPSKHIATKQFIEETLSRQQLKNITVSVINEKQADKFAKSLGKEIAEHESE